MPDKDLTLFMQSEVFIEYAARVFLRVISLHKASTTAFCSDGLLAISVLVE